MEETAQPAPAPLDPFARIRTRSLLLWIPAGAIALLALFAGAFPKSVKDPYRFLALVLAFSVSQAVWIGWQQRRHGLSIQALVGPSAAGDDWKLLRMVFPIILVSLGSTWLVYVPLSYLFPRFVTEFVIKDSPELFIPGRIAYNFVIATLVVIIAPIIEEILFRGFLLRRWAHKWGLQRAVVGTSVVFGLLHADVLGHFAFGVVMCLLYVRTGTLRMPIAAHMLNNAIAIALVASPFPKNQNPYSLAEFRSHWWVGAICMTLGLILLARFTRGSWDLRRWQLPPITPITDGLALTDRTAPTEGLKASGSVPDR